MSTHLHNLYQQRLETFEPLTQQRKLKVALLPSPFKIESGTKLPIILVATGAGIAPMRAFWQQKSLSIQNYGPFHLYFGCKSPTEDFIYEEEI